MPLSPSSSSACTASSVLTMACLTSSSSTLSLFNPERPCSCRQTTFTRTSQATSWSAWHPRTTSSEPASPPSFKDVPTLIDMLTYSYAPIDEQKMTPDHYAYATLNVAAYNSGSEIILYDPPIEEFSVVPHRAEE